MTDISPSSRHILMRCFKERTNERCFSVSATGLRPSDWRLQQVEKTTSNVAKRAHVGHL